MSDAFNLDALASDISVGIHGRERPAALSALCLLVAEVEKLREMDAERASELRYLEAENTRLRDILDRRFEGGAP
jgi:hypothetical protein